MRLRRPCEHDRYDPHIFVVTTEESPNHLVARDQTCPGGEFLPEDALLIEKVDGLWPQWVEDAFAPGPKGFSSLPWNTVMDRMLTGATT